MELDRLEQMNLKIEEMNDLFESLNTRATTNVTDRIDRNAWKMNNEDVFNNFFTNIEHLQEVLKNSMTTLKKKSKEGKFEESLAHVDEIMNNNKLMEYSKVKELVKEGNELLQMKQKEEENKQKKNDLFSSLEAIMKCRNDINSYYDVELESYSKTITYLGLKLHEMKYGDWEKYILTTKESNRKDIIKELRTSKLNLIKQRLGKEVTSSIKDDVVCNNLDKLEEWSGCEYNKVLYNSDIDDKTNTVLLNRIKNHNHLYFIVTDTNNNTFGHYHIQKMLDSSSYGAKFMFTLNNNGRCDVKKYSFTKQYAESTVVTNISKSNKLYSCNRTSQRSGDGGYFIDSFDENGGYFINTNELFNNFSTIEVIGNKTEMTKDTKTYFHIKKLLIVEMKEL